jgi:cobaltochelatase CobN
MHLLATTAGVIDGAAEAVDLKQSPADVVLITAADSEIASVANAFDAGKHASLRIASLLHLQHNLSVDLYAGQTLAKAKLIVLRLLGGEAYWRYGLEQVEALAAREGIKLAVLPGDARHDRDLMRRSTLDSGHCERLRQYLAAGGATNARSFLDFCQYILKGGTQPAQPAPVPASGIYKQTAGEQRAGMIFYRAVIEGAQTAPIDAMVQALASRGIGCDALYVASLKDEDSVSAIHAALSKNPPDVILNFTSFAAGVQEASDPLKIYDCPILQVTLAGGSEATWRGSSAGLGPRDLAMNVVLPELDGRIAARAVSFKSDSHWHEACQCRIATHSPVPDRIAFVADLASSWIKLHRTEASKRNIAIVLANYPIRDGRIANGVGYDTPASTCAILRSLASDGYAVENIPPNGNELIQRLAFARTVSDVKLPVAEYRAHFENLPQTVREQVIGRWGEPENDPNVHEGAFNIPVLRLGNVAIGLQPSRGYDINPGESYHDPALVPPHAYLAFYFWLRHVFGSHALIHNGKHGNAEWLPGKSVALSENCFPETCLGPLPHLYPFIVNDPGEGTQAKRRGSAVIIDHLTPPLTRAETYGVLRDLEALVDEYYLASSLDPRRAAKLKNQILEVSKEKRIDRDAGFSGNESDDLNRLDTFICDLKEAQIRDGLHIFGTSPEGQQEHDLLVALVRAPRGLGTGKDQSLIRALAEDFDLGFDPLNCKPAEAWAGPRPTELMALTSDTWRSHADAIERLELFAQRFEPAGPRSAVVLAEIDAVIRPALRSCGTHEMQALIRGLAGKRIEPGPSGAPTRGRLDVLPTGRNFYSIDNRTLPTPMAWTLGEKSAAEVLKRHFQDFGRYPSAIGLTAWGTSNMRTGGDDIAQALALLGVKPVWDSASWRVTGYEIQPVAKLGRPRVDVTLRISGFFRDAFPMQIELLDKAIRAVALLEEDDEDNPLAARTRIETAQMKEAGLNEAQAHELASRRIFGSKPGAYGAGLQAMIDERIWSTRADLAAAYIAWGSFAYGATLQGAPAAQQLKARLSNIEAVIHNQDNREHDLLDSDDYYQFEGGMSVAVEASSGRQPRVYHNDHSRPETPRARTLDEEVARVMRSRVVNPKWVAGVKRHGYKGAFEIAATVDYMFAFAATTGAVKHHHFDLAYDAFLVDEDTRSFIAQNNPAALREIAARFEEALERGLWTPRLNSAYDRLKEFQQ